MNEILTANLRYLAKNQAFIYAKVIDLIESYSQPKFIIEEARNGMANIKSIEHTRYLYSVYDPLHEATRWCDTLKYETADNKSVIMFGLGLTYHLGVFMGRYKNAKVFIVEPSVHTFIEMLKIIDVSVLYSHPNIMSISIGVDEDMHLEFMKSISNYSTFPFQYISLPYMKWLNHSYEKKLLRDLKELQISKKAIQGFRQTFGTQMFINTMRNLPVILSTSSIRSLANKFKNSTVLVVGGGPSLQDDIEYIKKMANDWIIITAGSSVQSLMHYNIQPHLMVSMDPGKANENVYRNNDFSNIPMVWMPQIYNTIPKIHPNYNYIGYYNNDAIINYFIDYQEEHAFIPTYSVTGTAIQIGAYLGANRIILAGQDLSYPGEQMYSPGANHVASVQNEEIRKELTFEVANVQGGINPTTFSMLQTLNDIGNLCVRMSDVSIINTSARGAVIEGTIYQSIEELIVQEQPQNLYPTNCLLPEYHELMYTSINIDNVMSKTRIGINYLNTLHKNIKKLKSEIVGLNKPAIKNKEKAILLGNIELILKSVTSHIIYTNVLRNWISLEIGEFERRAIEVIKANQIDQKIDLTTEIVGKLIADIELFLPTIINEFSVLYDSLAKSNKV